MLMIYREALLLVVKVVQVIFPCIHVELTSMIFPSIQPRFSVLQTSQIPKFIVKLAITIPKLYIKLAITIPKFIVNLGNWKNNNSHKESLFARANLVISRKLRNFALL